MVARGAMAARAAERPLVKSTPPLAPEPRPVPRTEVKDAPDPKLLV